MLPIILSSIVTGIIAGLVYARFFYHSLSTVHQKYGTHNKQISHSKKPEKIIQQKIISTSFLFFAIRYFALFGFLLFFFILFKLNLVIFSIFFIIAFWMSILALCKTKN